ncbi:hypothetical protein GCM10025868_21530 [Angustibacter aerolatus]|uniref:Uncharacterized protein n=1 Tax=Angustibacter aerolatus TaxID=1162965 RepID=A0ABQ6JFD6_9ACTN|nr:hypothetical protein GCM10025868_21530 [Angustibacter aerolatus]
MTLELATASRVAWRSLLHAGGIEPVAGQVVEVEVAQGGGEGHLLDDRGLRATLRQRGGAGVLPGAGGEHQAQHHDGHQAGQGVRRVEPRPVAAAPSCRSTHARDIGARGPRLEPAGAAAACGRPRGAGGAPK